MTSTTADSPRYSPARDESENSLIHRVHDNSGGPSDRLKPDRYIVANLEGRLVFCEVGSPQPSWTLIHLLLGINVDPLQQA